MAVFFIIPSHPSFVQSDGGRVADWEIGGKGSIDGTDSQFGSTHEETLKIVFKIKTQI